MDFAPYQDASPETSRALSPPPLRPFSPPIRTSSPSKNASPSKTPVGVGVVRKNTSPPSAASPSANLYAAANPWDAAAPNYYYQNNRVNANGYANIGDVGGNGVNGGNGIGGIGNGGNGVNGIGGTTGAWLGGWMEDGRGRLHEFETSLPLRLDYEACLAYLALPPAGGVILLLLEHKSDYVRFHAWQSSLLFTAIFVVHLIFSWTMVLSWMFFMADLALIAWLTVRAYRDADTLDRYEVPIFGRLANSILDDE